VVRFSERRAGECFVCIAEVRTTMFQGFSSPGRAFDMLIKFREPCFQIILVKIPSYNKCCLGIWIEPFSIIEENKVIIYISEDLP
jgi:hypothetical protein